MTCSAGMVFNRREKRGRGVTCSLDINHAVTESDRLMDWYDCLQRLLPPMSYSHQAEYKLIFVSFCILVCMCVVGERIRTYYVSETKIT